MRAQFEEGVKDTRVSCSEGTFDKTGASDGWADMVVIAQVSIPPRRAKTDTGLTFT